ncbi:MAG: primosomal protein DnaI [Anaeroplasmataceae bacterium]|nr:primosomal protein DnaI [Anaeroplasmataceae bacterium]
MRKINIEFNEKEVNSFIEKLKKDPFLEGFDITSWNANDFALYAEEHKNCAGCKGLAACKNTNQGYALEYVNSSFVLAPCKYKMEAKRQENESQKIKTLFVPKSILQADLQAFDATTEHRKKIYEYIVKFIQKMKNKTFTKGLYIHGGFATGKTFILGCIANELARNDIESLIIYFPDLVVELKNAIGTSRLEELINYLKSVDVLLLDDLGSENMTPWLRDEVLGPVLNYRLMEEKPVFISSNLNPGEELEEQLATSKSKSDSLKAQRIVSRLNGLVQTIELDNRSYKR